MTENYQEQQIAEHYIGIIKQKREQGFTDEQIAKDVGLPTEVVARCNTEDALPENPDEPVDKTPIQNEEVLERDENGKPIVGKYKFEENMNAPEENTETKEDDKIDVKSSYTISDAINDMCSDDVRTRLVGEYNLLKIKTFQMKDFIRDCLADQTKCDIDVRHYIVEANQLESLLVLKEQEIDALDYIESQKEENTETEKEEE